MKCILLTKNVIFVLELVPNGKKKKGKTILDTKSWRFMEEEHWNDIFVHG